MARHSSRSGNRNHSSLDRESASLMKLVDADRHADVEIAARRILKTRPVHALALKALGFALIGQERCAEALPILEQAISRHPGDPELHNNLGIVLSALMRWNESLSSFDRSLALAPNDPEVLKNSGAALVRMGRLEAALPYFIKAIEFHPGGYPIAVQQLASTLLKLNRNDEAWVCFNELWKADSENASALVQLMFASLKRCQWDEFPEHSRLLRSLCPDLRELNDSPFALLAFPGVSAAELCHVATNFAREFVTTTLLAASPVDFATQEAPRLRIGYLSTDFKVHPVGWIIPELLALHDRGTFEIFGYSVGTDDGSALRQRLIAAFDHFADLFPCSIDETVARIRADRIDILIDLNGWTGFGRTEALVLRCAPLQINWLGYAGTFGHPRLADYLIGDPVVTPAAQQSCYTETLAQLPGCYLPFDTTAHLPSPPSRREMGLPEEGFIYCSFNNAYKYNPVVFDLWCAILRETEESESVLWLGPPGGSAADRLRMEVAKRGVAPERLLFAERVDAREDHLARLQLADLALDPFPYNSHSTGLEILWAGVPMVALLGETFAGRVGASLLRSAGLDELIAGSTVEYQQIAVELAKNPQRLHDLRTRLSDGRRTSPLFDMPAFVRALESLYRRMWDDHRQGVRQPLLA